jgi:hypothetical protein
MAHRRSFVLITLAGLPFAATANAQSFEGPFRGMLVCGQLKTATNMQRAPLDLIIHGNQAVFAQPIFNLDLARPGRIDPDANLHGSAGARAR